MLCEHATTVCVAPLVDVLAVLLRALPSTPDGDVVGDDDDDDDDDARDEHDDIEERPLSFPRLRLTALRALVRHFDSLHIAAINKVSFLCADCVTSFDDTESLCCVACRACRGTVATAHSGRRA
jgi:hypothetical protein